MNKFIPFLTFLVFTSCSKESPLQPVDYDHDESRPFAAKVICDSLTDSSDHASLDSLLAVVDSLRAIEDSLSIVLADTASGIEIEDFSLDLTFSAEFTEEQQNLISRAVSRWEEVIIGGLPNVIHTESLTIVDRDLYWAEVNRPAGEIDDLSIFVYGHDGTQSTRSVLSKVIEFRDDGVGLPLTAIFSIRLDRWDVLEEGGYLPSLIQHEVGHCLGFLPYLIGFEVSSHPSFTGALNWKGGYLYSGIQSTSTFLQMLTDSALFDEDPIVEGVPLDSDRSVRSGYRGHWRSPVFDNELMTGVYRGTHETRPLSKLTVALMEDLGYEVDYEAVDDYWLTSDNVLLTNEPRGKVVVNGLDELSCGHQF